MDARRKFGILWSSLISKRNAAAVDASFGNI
jgi:hypothetical protein